MQEKMKRLKINRMEENIDKQDRLMATEGSDIEIDKDGCGDTLHGVEEQREEENASEKEDAVNEEEEGEENEDGGYTFGFENGMNPLDLVCNSDFGIQCYQKLQQYEDALASKKGESPEPCPIVKCSEGISFKKAMEDYISEEKLDEIMEAMNFADRKRSRKAIELLHEVVRLEPNIPDSYHILGLVHREFGDYKKEMEFNMIAAYLTPKDSSLWQRLFVQSIEQGDIDQADYCLSKAINADPKDSSLLSHRAMLHSELQNFREAAEAYKKLHQLCPENVDALKAAAKFYQKCGEGKCSVHILELYLENQSHGINASVVDLLGTISMEIEAYDKVLDYIEQYQKKNSGNELPLNLKVKAGICHIHLGNMEMAQVLFNDLKPENASKHVDLVTEVADALMRLEHYSSALNYFQMLKGNTKNQNGLLYMKIARCYRSLGERLQAIDFFYKVANEDMVSALETLPDDVDARITLASLLLEEGKEDEAISLLSPPKDFGTHKNGKSKRRLSKRDLFERARVLDSPEKDNVFRGFRPVAPASDLSKASRAKKLLQKKAIQKEKKKAEALASGIDWASDDSDDEPQKVKTQPPSLSNFLKDEEHHQLIIDLCNALAFLERYREALEIINHTLRLAHTSLSAKHEETLQSLGAQMAYNNTDPKHGFGCVKYIVQQNPHSVAAWNCYYKVISRLENRDTRHDKFVRSMQEKFVDCVPPILISGHQFTQYRHHQDAARKYLEAYKLLPENPLVNLCVGTALINLALGFRLQNKHQCVVQGLAFLYNNVRICNNSQESLYNLARAFHQVGLVTLATMYYEKVIAIRVKDYPIPKLPNEKPNVRENPKPGY